MPKRLVLLLSAFSLAVPAFAVDPAIKKQLEKLDPATRLEQSCDTEAMSRINKDDTGYRPDKVIAYTFKDPVPSDNKLDAPGAVFRSKGDWYHLSYTCITGPQHMNVRELDYKIGEKVPKEKWEKYYLYD
ncbi:hypothetical protein J2W42_001670 [Rhizobium tibeticum]|uniref:DUF930 domain-containing protein n=2 Tax=Rhizobium TaxID=379 RepID=A0A1H8FYT4_9HYPH|nr:MULTISPECIES: DUF930 domain-containing protein [Rhizobium]MCA0801030.1 DUF930 domain-containing protein [Rhizobium sp. T1473]MCS0458606.1 DUF930 domain-containing protein [Rhizobium favelukesii]MDP9808828.1 hypothetical protein [Rhizobium tibeticum]UFS81415.1 DUF930 domain-containing protein [Rhizobium sp. T136]CDM56886.1 hypothetical protein LPU83_1212 [Rhizobium favelukesii]